MKVQFKERHGYEIPYLLRMLGVWRIMRNYLEANYWSVKFFDFELGINIEFPSDWHEDKRGILRVGLGLIRFSIFFPWFTTYEDHHQCEGPRFGFMITNSPVMGDNHFNPMLWLWWGNDDGNTATPQTSKFFYFLTDWGSCVRTTLVEGPETYDFKYVRSSGEVQERKATIKVEEREWRRKWIPSKHIARSINIDFDKPVGEGIDTWKGGTYGLSTPIELGETGLQALRRIEREEKF